ncbi:MAG TPA: nuclear transport factor 2 family protein [Pyrinomonadaceae bacterium]
MKIKHLFLIASLFIVFCGSLIVFAVRRANADTPPPQQSASSQIIAREKAAHEAWQRKDKAFYADYMADDATYFGPMNPYLETDPKTNFLPKFEKYAEQFKYDDFQMYNPRVQVYGDTAILTYNASFMISMGGQPVNYTSKMTSVYAKQGNVWRVVHGHESINPSSR